MSVLVWSANNNIGNGNWTGMGVAGTEVVAVENVWGAIRADPVITSTNGGTSWAAGTTSVNFRPQTAAYNGSNTVVVVGNGNTAGTGRETYRRVGGVWGAGGAMPAPAAIWFSVAWNGTTFCAVKNGGAATSVDGTGWASRVVAVSGNTIVISHNTKFVTVGSSDSNCYVSTDNGASWTSHAMTSNGWLDAVSNGSRIVAVGVDKIAYSDDDGSTWTEVPVLGTWIAVEWNGSVFCAVGSTNISITSSTGAGWTAAALPSGAGVVFAGAMGVISGNFVFVGFQTGSPFYSFYTSAPGFVEFWRNEKNCEETDS